MIRRRTTLAALGLGLLLIACGSQEPADTSASPASRDADWCNLLLEPSVGEHLGLEVATRIRLAKQGARLLRRLRGGSPSSRVMALADPVADKLGAAALEQEGRKARDLLPAPMRTACESLLRAGALVPVRFWTEKRRGAFGRRFFLTFGWMEEAEQRRDTKSLRALESDLENCHEWIDGEAEAHLLAEAEDRDVQRAARRVLNPRPPTMSAEERARRNAEAQAFAASSRQKQLEREQRHAEKLRARAAEREARRRARR